MTFKKDTATHREWLHWHNNVKRELGNLLPQGARSEKDYHLGKEMKWGHLDSYKPDVACEIGNRRVFFEGEYFYQQDKIIDDIISASIVGIDQLVFIFNDKLELKSGWNGEKRVRATEYLAEMIGELVSKPISVKAIAIEETKELRQRLEKIGVL
jgi:hypothetical protein